MLKLTIEETLNYDMIKGFFNKRVGTIKIFKDYSQTCYIGQRLIGSKEYECYELDETYYFKYMNDKNTKIENYDDIEQIFIHCKWQEYIAKNI